MNICNPPAPDAPPPKRSLALLGRSTCDPNPTVAAIPTLILPVKVVTPVMFTLSKFVCPSTSISPLTV